MAETRPPMISVNTDMSEKVNGHTADESRIGHNTDEKEDFENRYLTGIAKWLVLGPVTLTYFTFFLDLAVLSTAAPAITTEFNSLVDIGWYGGAYQLGSAAFQPVSCILKMTALKTEMGKEPQFILRRAGDKMIITPSASGDINN
ncbi:hypothetical protein NUW58_g5721 [Xylaria curta]|uniref:Uncharacterized protein n=1 Tax=Xylaria curta TaxID=42375 RepID=A0ACC1P1G6_9PEZI|nr:hypothetical protein NUW58_g5721 [Xylaria curta]